MRTQIVVVVVVVVGGGDVVVVVLGGGGDVVVVFGAGADVVVVFEGGGGVVVEAGGWPELLEGAVTGATAVDGVPPFEREDVTVPVWPNPAPAEDVDPPGEPVWPFFALFMNANADGAVEGWPETAPGEAVEPEAGAAAADGARPCTVCGGSLGRDPPGATTTSTASSRATPARPASMPRRWDPRCFSSAPSSGAATPGHGSSNFSRIWKSASGSGVSWAPGVAPLSSMSRPFLVRQPGRRFPRRRTGRATKAYGRG
jgi:hypothetical protein